MMVRFANDSVGNEQLKSGIVIGINAATAWLTATVYDLDDTVYQGNIYIDVS